MKARGTLIRRSPLTETSLIVHWCTHEHGIVKTVAKGARRPKSPFRGKLDLFYLCEVEIHEAKKGDLHILKDLKIESPRLGLRANYLRTLAASYFVKLIEKVSEDGTPIAELADLLDRGLNYLDSHDADPRGLLHFEKQTAEILGILEPGRPPALCIADVFGSLPSQRGELTDKIEKPSN